MKEFFFLLPFVAFVVVMLLLINKYRHLRVLRQELARKLALSNEKRNAWKNPWLLRVQQEHARCPSANTQQAIIALATLEASQSHAGMDWSFAPATDILLKNEWGFEEALVRLLQCEWKDHSVLHEEWQVSQNQWNAERQLMNAYTAPLAKEQSDFLAQLLERIVYLPYPTVWMERASFAVVNLRLQQALDTAGFD